jgi:hypothetical protein
VSELRRRRGAREIVRDSLALYRARWRTFMLIALAVVAPVDVIISGIGLGDLTAGYRETQSDWASVLVLSVGVLLTTPLVTAMVVLALEDSESGAGRAIQEGLDRFAPLVPVVLAYGVGVGAGLLLFVVPGLFMAIRWSVFVQAFVVERKRHGEALAASWELTKGAFWRTLGVVVLVNVLGMLVVLAIGEPVRAAAEAADSQAIVLAGGIVLQALTLPFVAIATTLLYFDLAEGARGRSA